MNKFKVGAVASYIALNAPSGPPPAPYLHLPHLPHPFTPAFPYLRGSLTLCCLDMGHFYISLGNREAKSYPNIASAPYVYNLASTLIAPITLPTPVLPFLNWTYVDTFFHAPIVFKLDLQSWAAGKQLTVRRTRLILPTSLELEESCFADIQPFVLLLQYPTYVAVTLESEGAELFIFRKAIPTEELFSPSTTRAEIIEIAKRDPTITRPTSIITENIILPSVGHLDTYYGTKMPLNFCFLCL